jgi:hypothetical protein
MALAADNIIETVTAMRANGVRFLTTPATYFEDPQARLDWSTIDADLDQFAQLGILVDRDDRATCCRSSRNRSRIARRRFARSSSATRLRAATCKPI